MVAQHVALRLARQTVRRQLLRPTFAQVRTRTPPSRPTANNQQRRYYAERSDAILSSDPAFKPDETVAGVPTGPGGPGNPAPSPAPASPATPSSTTPIPTTTKLPAAQANVTKVQTAPPTSTGTVIPAPPPSSPPPPPPPAPKKRFRRTRLLLWLIVLSALGYGGAVFYALRSDNFHDFFTEYVPFGEDAVLYFEEQSFQRRFPNARSNVYKSGRQAPENDEKVKIPWKSGLSWKEVEQKDDGKSSDVSQRGRHMSAVDSKAPSKEDVKTAQVSPDTATPKEITKATEAAKSKTPSRKTESLNAPDKPKAEPKVEPKPATSPAAKPGTEATHPSPATPSPKSDPRPPALAPVAQISPLQVPNADEPVVQELVKILNDLITVVNADTADAANKLSAPMTKAKDSLTDVASKISSLRDAERKAAEERVQQAHKEFDEGAVQLLQRFETAQKEDEARFREDFETERARLVQSYEERLKNELERTSALADQNLKNKLSEQAIELKKSFVSEIQSLVEEERSGRLSKLTDLSTNVDNLTQLTSDWNGVIDSNLATQKLQVAVDSVRAVLASSSYSESKPKPFVREMAALKLVANGDPIVDAAIASINPSAYQKGIPSQPQLIDRFRRVASEVRKAALLPEDAGIASHAASFLLSNVMFKKQGQPQGNDVESILTRTEGMLEEGNIDGAARELNGLTGWSKVLSKDLLNDMRKVLEVRQALEVVEAEARLQCLRVD